jgi:hypothetical protein
MDSRHLQATITRQSIDSFGGSAGTGVLISNFSAESILLSAAPLAELQVPWFWSLTSEFSRLLWLPGGWSLAHDRNLIRLS